MDGHGKFRRMFTVSAIVVLAHLVGFATSLHALMGTRTAPGTVAWVVSLNAMPYIAVPAYWVFGRDRIDDYVQLRRKRVTYPAPLVPTVPKLPAARGCHRGP